MNRLGAGLLAIAFTAFAATHAQPLYDAKLMTAAGINFARAVQSRCEMRLPGYSQKLDAAYEKARSTYFLPAGVDDALMAQAEKNPELATPSLVARFDKLTVERQTRHCGQHLQGFLEAAEGRAAPIDK